MEKKREKGTPSPLGASKTAQGYNFAIVADKASHVFLGLFSPDGKEVQEYACHQSGSIWHIEVLDVPKEWMYAFRADGPKSLHYDPSLWLSDPYAQRIEAPKKWKEEKKERAKAFLPTSLPFDWQGISSPWIEEQDLIIYEMHVRGWTRDSSSGTEKRKGSFLAMIEKIPHLKRLGVNAIELMPIFEWDETDNFYSNPFTKEKLCNYWGYDPLHFFAPMRRLAEGDPTTEFKTMVREMHRHGILVFLDVVYNHTGEKASLRRLNPNVYYQRVDVTGCGHTLNVNHPVVRKLILDSLRYWGSEMQVDGFRFDLAAVLTRDEKGHPMKNPPLLEEMEKDPVLSKKRLIAEPWDAAGLYLAGWFAGRPQWKEWNGEYRDSVRKFLKGTDGCAGAFAGALCGSERLFKKGKSPLRSVNFITAHDGFSLRDLVTYQKKHNETNGERNRDGSNHNCNWNCGVEGPTDQPLISHLRERQMRGFFLALFLSQGTPMLLMGDEYGHSRKGNNNPYAQDNEINWFDWDHGREDIVRFVQALISFRKQHACFRRSSFLTEKDITFHGHKPYAPNWGFFSRFVAFSLDTFYVAFNAHYKKADIELPDGHWYELVNTSFPWDSQGLLHSPSKCKATLSMQPYSAILLTTK